MRDKRLILKRPLLLLPILLLALGCARTRLETLPTETRTINSIKAKAIVEFTRQDTEKGRAIITVNNPDSFQIVIKGPLGTTAALISGSKENLTFLWRGKLTTFLYDDPRLPFNIRASEIVSLLLGAKNFPPRQDHNFETRDLPDGRSITKRVNNDLLYRAVMRDYRVISDDNRLPFNISIKGKGYKLLVKYLNVDINTEVNNSYSKTTS